MTDPIPEPLTLREAAQALLDVHNGTRPLGRNTWADLERALARQATPDLPDAEAAWRTALADPAFRAALDEGLHDFAEGRVTPWADVVARLAARQATPASGGLDVETVGRTLIQFIGTDASDVDPERFAATYARLTSEATSDREDPR